MAEEILEGSGSVKPLRKKHSTRSEKESSSSDLLNRMRANPWMVATVVLAVVLVVVLFMRSGSSASVSSQTAGSKLVDYLNTQVQGGGVTLKDVVKDKSMYKVSVEYQGTAYPFYVTLDGSSFASSLSSFEGATPTAPTAPAKPVTIDAAQISDAPVKGSSSAKVTLVEFSDYQCPFCERFYSDAYKQIVSEYIDTGKVKLVFMNFPLSFHENAEPAARAALCFRKVKANSDAAYFQYHNKLFENQASLSTANYKKWARELGGNGAQFDSCFDNNEFADRITAESAYGASIGISGTPGFFINGVPLVGAQPFSAFKQVIDAELAKAA